MKQNVKGISLIVLVITIIIIIILAGAVILSLSNSNVINKAKSGIMQTDVSTIKEQIKTKMAENELNNVNTKIGTQLWDSFYTMTVSQLQEIGVSAKNDCIYDYNTGNLSIKQNDDYVTPEELYGKDSATNYIDGYVLPDFVVETVTDAKIAAETNATAKAALQKQQLIQKYTNSGIKIGIYDIDLAALFGDPAYDEAIKNPKYTTQVTSNGYFLISNITVEAGKTYSIAISDFENTLDYVKTINFNNYMNKTLFTKTSPLKLYVGDIYRDLMIDGGDAGAMFNIVDTSNIKKYDFNKDGVINPAVGTPDHNILFGANFETDATMYTQVFN